MARPPKASVVIPTLNRPESYANLRRSLDAQTEQAFEVLTLTERGPLAALRNRGLRRACGPVVCFLDDDVVCPPTWLVGVLNAFHRPGVVGVSGPAVIPADFRSHRALFRYRRFRWVYDQLFLDSPALPGHLTRAGCFTTAAAEATCTYEGPVDYLEACNMAFHTEALKSIGGFDEVFGGIGDWSEPDAALRVLRATGGMLWFTPDARLVHQPAGGSTTLLRRSDAHQRLANARLFHRRYRFHGWRHHAYRAFLTTYYTAQGGLAWRSWLRKPTA